jgi:hypothetical protein
MRWGDLVADGEARRRRVRELGANGMDGVEVRDGGRRLLVYFLEHVPAGVEAGNVRIDAPAGATPVHVLGVRRAAAGDGDDEELQDRLVVELRAPGSPGLYRLALVHRRRDGSSGSGPFPGLDPRFADATFRFDVDAPLPPIAGAPASAAATGDEVSYLSRDYEGLRRLMLDRLAVTMPAWTETHVPDVWITLVELLAYVGDDLSYYEDAVATEAYLQTARRRVSVRRHARLVGYRLHDGCHARAWVSVKVSTDVVVALAQLRFVVVGPVLEDRPPVLDAGALDPGRLAALQQYSPLPAFTGSPGDQREARFWRGHHDIKLWSWGEPSSRLVAGATCAVLADGHPVAGASAEPLRRLRLEVGDVIVLEETHDPATRGAGPGNPAHRQAVRLTAVRRCSDELYDQPLLEVHWAPQDALRFDLVVRAGGHACGRAVANVLLVAHGQAVSEPVDLGAPVLAHPQVGFSTPFPDPAAVAVHQSSTLRALYGSWRHELHNWLWRARRGHPLDAEQLRALRGQLGVELEELGLTDGDRGERDEDEPARRRRAERDADALEELLARAGRLLAPRRRRLEALARQADASGPLSDVLVDELRDDWGSELTAGLSPSRPGSWGPAAGVLDQDPRAALALLELRDPETGDTWRSAPDLVGLVPGDRAVLVEVDDQDAAALRVNGAGPSSTLRADYWIGNGRAGNAEQEAINAVVWLGDDASESRRAAGARAVAAITAVRNPLPAAGGTDPEDVAAARLAIPGSFADDQPRALTVADYEELAGAVAGVRAAAAWQRSTGSLSVIDVAVAPTLGEDPHPALLTRVRRALEAARRIGHVVRVHPPRYRPLRVAVDVSLDDGVVRSTIAATLAGLLSSGWMPDGTPALFNPVRLTFAGAVYSSPVIAALHSVAGVQSAVLTAFAFADAPAGAAVADSLAVGTLEIARLDNDPTAPEHGYAVVSLRGGR